jgi:hypothetical protein
MWEGGITIAPPEGVWEAQLHPIAADDRLTITRPLILSMRDEGYDANGGIVIVFRQNATHSINEAFSCLALASRVGERVGVVHRMGWRCDGR